MMLPMMIFLLLNGPPEQIPVPPPASYRIESPGFLPAAATLTGSTMRVRGAFGPLGAGVSFAESFVLYCGVGGLQYAASGIESPQFEPLPLVIYPNRPNPFWSETAFRFQLPRPMDLGIDIFDIAGRRVFSETARSGPGPGQIVWNGRGAGGRSVPSGIYLYRITCGKATRTGRVAYIR